MSKHTPGPWRVKRDKMSSLNIISQETQRTVVNLNAGHKNWIENARLIAAAPELLSACENYIRCCADQDCSIPDLVSAQAFIRKAIAKATDDL